MRNRLMHIETIQGRTNKREYKPLKYPEIPLSVNDVYIITTVGDRLDSLAQQFYGDVRLWWVITSANMNIIRRDSYSLKPGLEIRIPHDIEDVLSKFEEINQPHNNL